MCEGWVNICCYLVQRALTRTVDLKAMYLEKNWILPSLIRIILLVVPACRDAIYSTGIKG